MYNLFSHCSLDQGAVLMFDLILHWNDWICGMYGLDSCVHSFWGILHDFCMVEGLYCSGWQLIRYSRLLLY